MTVGDLGEFALIARIARQLRAGVSVAADATVELGPGDDAAVLAAPDRRVVASVDLLVEGRHFRRDWSSAYDIGRKAAAQSLADIAAMGAHPTGLLVGLGCPADTELDWVDELTRGLAEECTRAGTAVVGGDVTDAAAVTLSVTALGDLRGRPPVTRSGAGVGDTVVVVGRIGYAEAGLALLRSGRLEHPLTAAHRRPEVSYAAAMVLAEKGATAMIDVSDGLVSDLGHVATASGVGVELVGARLAVPPELAAAGRELDVDPLVWLAGGGDDHAFAAALPSDRVDEVRAVLSTLPEPVGLMAVGQVVAGPVGVRFLDRGPAGPAGHEHFAASTGGTP